MTFFVWFLFDSWNMQYSLLGFYIEFFFFLFPWIHVMRKVSGYELLTSRITIADCSKNKSSAHARIQELFFGIWWYLWLYTWFLLFPDIIMNCCWFIQESSPSLTFLLLVKLPVLGELNLENKDIFCFK